MSPGWRGYGCTDGREAFSDTSQLIEVLLLTLSNLFFFPAIIVALYRRHYIEAVVYFYNMFTSAVSDFIFASDIVFFCFFCLCQCHSITLRIWSTSAICSFSWCVTCSLCLLLWGRVFFGISTTLVRWGHDLILKHTLVKEWMSMCPEEMKFKMEKCKFFCMTIDKTKTKLNLQMDTFAHFLHFLAKSGLHFGFPISYFWLFLYLIFHFYCILSWTQKGVCHFVCLFRCVHACMHTTVIMLRSQF